MYKDVLEELKLLNNKCNEEELILNDDDAARWNELCTFDNTYDLRDYLLDALDQDKELTKQILAFLNDTGTRIQEIAFGGVGVGLYLLQKLYPTMCSYNDFGDFWIDTCQIGDQVIDAVDQALNRAIDDLIAEE